MKTLTLDGFAKKTTQLATSVTRKLDEKKKPSSGFIANALMLPMIIQLFRLVSACVLTFLAIALTAISTVYTNLKEQKK